MRRTLSCQAAAGVLTVLSIVFAGQARAQETVTMWVTKGFYKPDYP